MVSMADMRAALGDSVGAAASTTRRKPLRVMHVLYKFGVGGMEVGITKLVSIRVITHGVRHVIKMQFKDFHAAQADHGKGQLITSTVQFHRFDIIIINLCFYRLL